MTPEEIREREKAELKAVKERHARTRKALRALAAMPDDERHAFIRARYEELPEEP